MHFDPHRPAPDPCLPFGLRAGLTAARRRPLVFLAAGWALGTAAGRIGGAPFWLWTIPALLCIFLTAWRRRLMYLCAAFLFLAALFVGHASMQPEPIEKQRMPVGGVLCAEPRIYEQYAMLTLDSVSLGGEAYPHRVRLYLYHNGAAMPAMEYGDRIETEACLSSPKGVTGAGAFDHAAYLWRSGVALTGNAGLADTTVSPGPDSPMRYVMRLRAAIGERLDRLYPNESALARALLLGDKSALSDEEYAAFKDAGIVHLLAVSGLHVSILAEALHLFFRKLLRIPRKVVFGVMLPLLLLYAAVAGFPASIMRAAICFALTEAAPLFSRSEDKLTGLSAAFLILCWCDPLAPFDAGFQLSFSAMLGLCMLSPVIASALTPAFMLRTQARRLIWKPFSTVSTSIAAAIGTMPAAASLFGGLTLWSLAVNILAIPITSAIMPVLLISLFAKKAAVPCEWAMGVLGDIALRFGTLPEKLYLNVPQMPALLTGLYALVLVLCSAQIPVTGLRRRKARRIKAACAVLIALFSGLMAAWLQTPVQSPTGVSITFFDVGQGDSILIDAQGQNYLVDTGENSAAARRLSARTIALDGLFLTHPDADHAGAAAQVIEAGHVKTVYLPECWQRLEVPDEISAALEKCELRYLSAGDIVPLSADARALVLHPPKGYIPETDNAASLVLLIEYGSGSALLMGDLADSDIGFPVPDCDLVKLAHHGSEYSSQALLLQAASPSAAILSVGLNSYGHPAPEVLGRLDRLGIAQYRTDVHGDITAGLHYGGGVSIDHWLDNGQTEDQ